MQTHATQHGAARAAAVRPHQLSSSAGAGFFRLRRRRAGKVARVVYAWLELEQGEPQKFCFSAVVLSLTPFALLGSAFVGAQGAHVAGPVAVEAQRSAQRGDWGSAAPPATRRLGGGSEH